MDQAFRDAITAGYALDRAGHRPRQRRCTTASSSTTRASRSPLSMLNRHGLIAGATGHRQDQDPAAPGRPALEGRRPGLRGRHQGRPDGPRRPGRRHQPEGPGAASTRWPGRSSRPATRSSSCRCRASSAPRSGRPSIRSGRCCSARSSTSTRPRRASSRSSSSTATTTTCRCSTSRTSRRRSSSSRRTRASRSSPTTAGCRRASVGVLLRSIVVLEQEGADVFFGEPEFDVEDLLRTTPDGEGIISVLELSDVMDKPRLFSTFMLWMLAQLYESLPEAGDLPEAEAVLLLRRGAPALRRRVGGAHGPGRADGAAHPLQGRRRLLRHPGPDRRPVVRSSPSSATASSTRCGRSRPTTPTPCARPRGPSR